MYEAEILNCRVYEYYDVQKTAFIVGYKGSLSISHVSKYSR